MAARRSFLGQGAHETQQPVMSRSFMRPTCRISPVDELTGSCLYLESGGLPCISGCKQVLGAIFPCQL